MKPGLTNVIGCCVCITGSLWCTVGQAYVLVDEPDRTLSLDVSSTVGVFHSQKNYQQWAIAHRGIPAGRRATSSMA